MSELSDAIANLSEDDRRGFDDFCRECTEATPEPLAAVFAWLADGGTAASPIAYRSPDGIASLSSDYIDVVLKVAQGARGVSSWVEFEDAGHEEFFGAVLDPPPWSEPVRVVWNLLAMQLVDEREKRIRDRSTFDDAVTEGLGIRTVGEPTVEPDDDETDG